MSEPMQKIYPIGQVGQPWGEAEKALWLSQQTSQPTQPHQPNHRSYQQWVVEPLLALAADPIWQQQAELLQYGELDYTELGLGRYPLYAVRSKHWQAGRDVAIITGGVHGYETSGVLGALDFITQQFANYSSQLNLLVLPCISPWGFSTINRWNPLAIDPNRSFISQSPSQEAAAVLALLATLSEPVLVHVDLHETTDSDNSEFRPAKAARDGTINTNWNIPDGFYLVGDVDNPQPDFQRAIITAVAQVTHIAAADETGCLIGEPLQQPGVINYPKKALGLCGGISNARFVTTTEVYPDSPNSTPELCNLAQLTTIITALDFALAAAHA